jgi:AraC-like DNA-binding protein/quercetin dioxygenase-like cupin family protein
MSQTGHTVVRPSAEVPRLEALPQAVVAFRRDLEDGQRIAPHRHRRAQLVYASRGVMTVTTSDGAFVVPPQRAVWMPGGHEHQIDARGAVAMRTIYVEPDAAPGLPKQVCVLHVTPLLRELILAAVRASQPYEPESPESRLMDVILDQIRALPAAPLSLPMPRDRRLRRVTEALRADPADARGLEAWAREAGASARTLARLFRTETGMSFGAWRQQVRLLRALEKLAAGEAVTSVAFDLGYDSPSAFIAMFRRNLGASPTRYFGSES